MGSERRRVNLPVEIPLAESLQGLRVQRPGHGILLESQQDVVVRDHRRVGGGVVFGRQRVVGVDVAVHTIERAPFTALSDQAIGQHIAAAQRDLAISKIKAADQGIAIEENIVAEHGRVLRVG